MKSALFAEVETKGFALVRPAPETLPVELGSSDPWQASTLLLGQAPELVERQPIQKVAWGRSFASTSSETPLHTDSQLFRGAPPDLQLMFCERPAAAGGDTTLVDGWALLSELEREDPELLSLLFHQLRAIPFVFGTVFGPTVSLRGGALVFTHSPMPLPHDPVAVRVARQLARVAVIRVRPSAGEVLVVDNHRMLHGRTAFEDESRAFTRLLVWLGSPLPSPERWRALAQAAQAKWSAERGERARRALGLVIPPPESARRRAIVLEMLRGVPPGVLARRHGVDEADLYAWRDRALAAADAELASDDRAHEAALELVKLIKSGRVG